MTRYITSQGDVLDAVCFAHYGREDALEAVLDANPGLADRGPILPAGVTINLPDLPATATTSQRIRLWD